MLTLDSMLPVPTLTFRKSLSSGARSQSLLLTFWAMDRHSVTPGLMIDSADMYAPSASVIFLSVSAKYSVYFSMARPLFLSHFFMLFLLLMKLTTRDIMDIGTEYISMLKLLLMIATKLMTATIITGGIRTVSQEIVGFVPIVGGEEISNEDLPGMLLIRGERVKSLYCFTSCLVGISASVRSGASSKSPGVLVNFSLSS